DWRKEEEKYLELLEYECIVFGKTGKAGPQLKVFASEKEDYGEVETSWWDGPATTTDGVKELNRIIPDHSFDNPKPTELLKKIIRHATDDQALILDSFAGSGTTAQAVLAQNKIDGGNRRFILVCISSILLGSFSDILVGRFFSSFMTSYFPLFFGGCTFTSIVTVSVAIVMLICRLTN